MGPKEIVPLPCRDTSPGHPELLAFQEKLQTSPSVWNLNFKMLELNFFEMKHVLQAPVVTWAKGPASPSRFHILIPPLLLPPPSPPPKKKKTKKLLP